MTELAAEAAAAVADWGEREILHWLVNRVSRPQPADTPAPEAVHYAIDQVHGTPAAPEPVAGSAPEQPPAYGA